METLKERDSTIISESWTTLSRLPSAQTHECLDAQRISLSCSFGSFSSLFSLSPALLWGEGETLAALDPAEDFHPPDMLGEYSPGCFALAGLSASGENKSRLSNYSKIGSDL